LSATELGGTAMSLNALRVVPNRRRGDFAQDSFFKNITNLISGRAVKGAPLLVEVERVDGVESSAEPREQRVTI
jgi:hypothetical protein